MKRLIMLWLAAIVAGVALADEVTQQQALQQAAAFVKQRQTDAAKAAGRHQAPHAEPQLEMAGRVDGLYLFNIADEGGYVIVSNDDLTDAVLSYADSGSLDTANMPQNMRAWLQGYADEIAWAKAHSQQLRALQQLNAQAPRQQQRASAVKTAVSPLLGGIEWNQDSPYNDMCPEYDGEHHAATGCVATAMAQVMFQNYKRFKNSTTPVATATTATITHKQLQETIAAGTTLQWNLMKDTYTSSDSDTDPSDAVALLMKCCGYALQMDYNESSGTQTSYVADALKAYFDFSSTTEYKPRSYYSYANWIELIYNELSQQRAVVYGGSSAGGGHAFVCDGYDAEDYFHINWGWGGQSNGSFKLSALNPSSQGIGGSSSTDGYHYGQDAVVGIQPTGATGTVLDIEANTINLTLNSITATPASVTLGETVTVTMSVTNNSADDYDGDIMIYDGSRGILGGATFKIGAGKTKEDCVVTFTPTSEQIHLGSYTIYAFKPVGVGYYYIDDVKSADFTVTGAATDNPTLAITVAVSTATQGEPFYDIYDTYENHGPLLNTTFTLTNNDAEKTFKGACQFALLLDQQTALGLVDKFVIVAPGASEQVQLQATGLEQNTNYFLLGGPTTGDGTYQALVSMTPAVVTYDKDGNAIVSTDPTYTATLNDAFVDMAGTGVTSVDATNGNPNCLYVVGEGEDVPEGLTGANVVTKAASGNYTASSITLTDANNFYSPEDIEVSGNITFTYTLPSIMADGTNGWNTIVLPFDVTQVTADDTPITWFTSDSDTSGRFWLKQFVSDEEDNLYFNYVEAGQMKANTPYIVALPGSTWGSTYDLTGKTIQFIGTNTTLHKSGDLMSVTGSNMRFVGTTKATDTENIYALNDEGNRFVLKATGGSKAFRAYVNPSTFDANLTSYSIRPAHGSTTYISFATGGEVKREGLGFYNLQGQRVEHPRKGLYISGGRKVVVR